MTPNYTQMPTWTPKELADRIAADERTLQNGIAKSELYRRELVFQEQASEAQRATAEHTRRNSTYMLVSVVVLTVSSVLSLFVNLGLLR